MKNSNSPKITVTSHSSIEGFKITSLKVKLGTKEKDYEIYVSEKEAPKDGNQKKFAIDIMQSWISDNKGSLPKEKYLVRMNGGKIPLEDISIFQSVRKNLSDLVRTNVTISAQLFEWAKAKAFNENTSFSDLVSRGLILLKDSTKETESWFNSQRDYFRKKLGNFGWFEIFHYLPNSNANYTTEQLQSALQRSVQRRTGWPIGIYSNSSKLHPYPQPDGIKFEFFEAQNGDYWFARTKGEFFVSRILESDRHEPNVMPNTALYFDTLIWRIAEAIDHCSAFYHELGVTGPERIKISIKIFGIKGRILSASNTMRAITMFDHICNSDSSNWEAEVSMNDLAEQSNELIYEAAKKLLVMFGFFVPNKDVVMDIVNKEYRKSNV